MLEKRRINNFSARQSKRALILSRIENMRRSEEKQTVNNLKKDMRDMDQFYKHRDEEKVH